MSYVASEEWAEEKEKGNFSIAFEGLYSEIAENLLIVNNKHCKQIENKYDVFNPHRFGVTSISSEREYMEPFIHISESVYDIYLATDKTSEVECEIALNLLTEIREKLKKSM